MINVNNVLSKQTSHSQTIMSKVSNNNINNSSSSSSSSSGWTESEPQQRRRQRTNEGMSTVIRNTILANNWKHIFAGIVVFDIVYIDGSLVIFDINFLARIRGIRLCIRKEPDYF